MTEDNEEKWEALQPDEMVFDTGSWSDGKIVLAAKGRGTLFGAKVRWHDGRYMKQTLPLQILNRQLIISMAKENKFVRAKDLQRIQSERSE